MTITMKKTFKSFEEASAFISGFLASNPDIDLHEEHSSDFLVPIFTSNQQWEVSYLADVLDYKVIAEINVSATSMQEAADKAKEILREGDTFTVRVGETDWEYPFDFKVFVYP